MPLTICDNMAPFMFPYLKWFERRRDSSKQADKETRSRTFTQIVVRFRFVFCEWMNKVHLYKKEAYCRRKLEFRNPSVSFEGRIALATIRAASDAQILAFLLTLA